MPGTPTTKYAIPTLAGSDLARDIDTLVTSSLNAIDSKMVGYSQGTLAARPTSTGGTPGIAGRRYRATDTGQEFIDTGTSWIEVARVGALPRFRFTPSSNQSITNNTDTLLNFATVAYDTSSFKETVGSDPEVRIPAAGCYSLLAQIMFAAPGGAAAGLREAAFLLNGGALSGAPRIVRVPIAADQTVIQLHYEGEFAAADLVAVNVKHTQGVALLVQSTGSWITGHLVG